MFFNVPNAGYICRRCIRTLTRHAPRLPPNRPAIKLTFRKTRAETDSERDNVRKIAKTRILKTLSDTPTAVRPVVAGRRRPIRPVRSASRASRAREEEEDGDELIPSVPSAWARIPEQVVPPPAKPASGAYNPVEHFNWYWETYPPNIKQTTRANKFFLNNQSQVKLLISAARFMHVPDSDVPEVAFVGCSNVGKSSLLNAIIDADTKSLVARTSKTPGLTKTMNFYGIGPGLGVTMEKFGKGRVKMTGSGGLVIVDMPGYGEGSLRSWGVEIMKYLQSRKQLRRVFVLIDVAHGIKDKDRSLLAGLRLAGVSHQVILSKMDKIYIPQGIDPKDIGGFQSRKAFKMKAKGTVEALRQKMEDLRPQIKPAHGAGALGELLACSSEVTVNGKRLGLDHVRFAILKAAGVEGKMSTTMNRLLEEHVAAEKQLEGRSVSEKLRAPGMGARMQTKGSDKSRRDRSSHGSTAGWRTK